MYTEWKLRKFEPLQPYIKELFPFAFSMKNWEGESLMLKIEAPLHLLKIEEGLFQVTPFEFWSEPLGFCEFSSSL